MEISIYVSRLILFDMHTISSFYVIDIIVALFLFIKLYTL